MRVVHLYSSLVTNKKSLNNFPWLLKSAECFYHTRNTRIQYIGDKCRVSVRFSVVGVHCHSLVLLPLTVTKHITGWHHERTYPLRWSYSQNRDPGTNAGWTTSTTSKGIDRNLLLHQGTGTTRNVEETLCAQARNATASKTLITPTPNTTHTNPQVCGGFWCDRSR